MLYVSAPTSQTDQSTYGSVSNFNCGLYHILLVCQPTADPGYSQKKRLLKQASGISEILLYGTIILEYVSGYTAQHPQTFHSPVEGKTHTNKSP